MTEAKRLAAATVLYNPDSALLTALCDGMRRSGTPMFVLCNSAIDADLRSALEREGGVTLLGNGTNIGLGAALNTVMEAADRAGFTHVILFDQDSTPDVDLPRALMERAAGAVGAIGAIGPRLTPPPGQGYKPIWYSLRGGGRPGWRPVDFLPTSGSLIPIAAWRRVGPFRADFFIDGIDVEWSFRAWKAGFLMILADDLTMPHRWGQPDDGTRRPQIVRQGSLRNAYYLRNNVYSLRLPHVPRTWKMRIVLRLAAQTLMLGLRGEGPEALRAIRAGWRGELGAIS
jgi:rhamnosyltransferase